MADLPTYQGFLVNGMAPVQGYANSNPNLPAPVAPATPAPVNYGTTFTNPPPPPPTYNAPAIPGVSGAVSSAVYASGYNPTTPVNQTTISGSGSVPQGTQTTTALNSGVAAVNPPPPTTTPTVPTTAPNGSTTLPAGYTSTDGGITYTKTAPTTDSNGNTVYPNGTVVSPTGQLVSQGTNSAPVVDPSTGNTTYSTGLVVDKNGNVVNSGTTATAPTVVSVSQPDTYGGTYSLMSNGQQVYNPPNPELAPYYTQASEGTTNENASYNNQANAAASSVTQQIAQIQLQQQNEVSAIQEESAAAGDGGSGDNTGITASVAAINQKYQTEIDSINANASFAANQLYTQHTANLENIQNQLTSAVSTYNNNLITSAQNTLSSVQKGGTLSPIDQTAVLQGLTASGMSPQAAQAEIDTSVALGNAVNNKTFTNEQRQQTAQYIGLWKNLLTTMTDPVAASQNLDNINIGLMANMAGAPAYGFASDGTPLYSDDQRSQIAQDIQQSGFKQLAQSDTVKFRNATLIKDYASLAQAAQLGDTSRILTYLDKFDASNPISGLQGNDLTGLATLLSQSFGKNPDGSLKISESLAENMIKTQAIKTEPTTSTSNQPGVSGLVLPPKVTTTFKGGGSPSSTNITPPASSASTFSASVGGQTYIFPDAASLANFKKQAGIQ